MGSKGSKSRASVKSVGPTGSSSQHRFKSERELKDEARAKRVSMLCRWIQDSDVESELCDFVQQLRELCGEFSARLFQASELQAALLAEATNVVESVVKAMSQFPGNDGIITNSLEIFKLIAEKRAVQNDEKCLRMQSEQINKVVHNLIQAGNDQQELSANDLAKLSLCVKTIELFIDIENLPGTIQSSFLSTLRDIARSISPNARIRKDFWAVLLLLIESDAIQLDENERRELSQKLHDSGYSLDHAAVREKTEVLRLMLEDIKINPNIEDSKKGRTPLQCAIEYGTLDAVEMLLSHGADAKQNGGSGAPPLLNALLRKDLNKVAAIIKINGVLDQTDPDGNNALHIAVLTEDVQLVKTVLAASGSDKLVNQMNNSGISPLLLLVSARSGECDENVLNIVKSLLSHGCDATANTSGGASALILAAHYNKGAQVMDLLIKAGCDITARYQDRTAYNVAEEEGASEDVLCLLRC